jgi:hypothetical protein
MLVPWAVIKATACCALWPTSSGNDVRRFEEPGRKDMIFSIFNIVKQTKVISNTMCFYTQ